MTLNFYKYQGTGNDFILLDNRKKLYEALDQQQIARLCHRRFGIGADGLMLLNEHIGYDFEMKYFNADGREGSMCGNGGRCLVKFAHYLGIHSDLYSFLAIDGEHLAEINDFGLVSLKMQDVEEVREDNGDYLLNTGSPHLVKLASDVADIDVYHRGMDIRFSTPYAQEGINVNFVEQRTADSIFVRTYERGVEEETLSCGTGVTAAALVSYHNAEGHNHIKVKTRGGDLEVSFDRNEDGSCTNIWLTGPAEKVFKGTVTL